MATFVKAPTTRLLAFAPGMVATPPLRLAPQCHGALRCASQRRTFLSFPGLADPAEPQQLTARRTLPYGSARLYDIIADIDAYPRFLPYCASTRVTRWSEPDPATGKRWPAEADLSAGWGGFEETYTSRVFCVPGSIVEAISGDARPEIPEADMQRLSLQDKGLALDGRGRDGVFKSLVTRWTVRPLEKSREGADWSEVHLSIKFRFMNPLYGAVSSAVADRVAPIMVDAFVKEAERVLGRPS